jgi:hypothetical protein
MPDKKEFDTKSDLPPGLAQPAIRALTCAGYTKLKQLTKVSDADLLKLHGMGPKAMALLKRELAAKGLSFKA